MTTESLRSAASEPLARGRRRAAPAGATIAVGALLALAGCTTSGGETGETDEAGERVEVIATFYPLLFVVEEVGGNLVEVADLTPPGADPHTLELSPAEVANLEAADLVVYVPTLQAAVDEALAVTSPGSVLDAAAAAGVAEESLSRDPHFWLDPLLMVDLAHGVADELATHLPEHADELAARTEDLADELRDLDTELAEGLAHCAGATLVVSHEAFGYLTDRYGLVQVGISGINPEAEPSPARLREVGQIVEEEEVSTLYFEVITSPAVTITLAEELGVATDVLDPLEGRTSQDADYLDVMRANLVALQRGLTCDAG